MKKYLKLQLDNIEIKGNVLDVCGEEKGVIYDFIKQSMDNKNVIDDIEYLEKNKLIEKKYYNTCFLFFVLSGIMFSVKRKKLIRELYSYLDENGIIYIWDIEKKIFKLFDSEVKIYLPDSSSKTMKIRKYNLFSSSSKLKTLKEINVYFKIVDYKDYGGVYLIKARRRE